MLLAISLWTNQLQALDLAPIQEALSKAKMHIIVPRACLQASHHLGQVPVVGDNLYQLCLMLDIIGLPRCV